VKILRLWYAETVTARRTNTFG